MSYVNDDDVKEVDEFAEDGETMGEEGMIDEELGPDEEENKDDQF